MLQLWRGGDCRIGRSEEGGEAGEKQKIKNNKDEGMKGGKSGQKQGQREIELDGIMAEQIRSVIKHTQRSNPHQFCNKLL